MTRKLSKEPYKGVRDFYPEDYFIQEYITNTMREVAERYGYVPYDASILEPTELYEAKTGDEIVNEQTYTFEDRGGRRVTLRPEMTPTVARMIARRRRELVFPVRWYSIPNLFRYERPQRGRLREHWQLNVDVFGISEIDAEIEIISIAYDIMKAFGLEDSQFHIRINSRKQLQKELKKMVPEKKIQEAVRLIDKKSKLSKDEFNKEWGKISKKPFVLGAGSVLDRLIDLLKERKIKNVMYDPELARGFDYYTDIVFEVFDTSPENKRSLFGGGRYDNLLEVFGEKPIPTVGFGMGDVTIKDVLETYNLLPIYQPTTQLCVCYADKKRKTEIDSVVKKLRQNGIRVITADPSKKVGDQIAYADKLSVPYVMCIGSQELSSDTFTIKKLSSGKETTLKQKEIADFFQK